MRTASYKLNLDRESAAPERVMIADIIAPPNHIHSGGGARHVGLGSKAPVAPHVSCAIFHTWTANISMYEQRKLLLITAKYVQGNICAAPRLASFAS